MATKAEDSTVSKSRFKARALEYLRRVERTGRDIVITDHGRPVCKIVRYTPDPLQQLARLRGSVRRYDRPTEPVVGWDSAR